MVVIPLAAQAVLGAAAAPANLGANKQAPEKREIGMKAIRLMSRRMWLDYVENGGPTWCRVFKGQPTQDMSVPNEAKQITDHAGYALKDLTHWADLAWNELFGRPKGPGCDGAQALLAICNGKVWDPAKRE